MALDKKYRGKITLENFDDCLMYTGYMLPENEQHLDNFNRLYEDFNFELSNKKIDAQAIINETLSCNIKTASIININKEEDVAEITKLRMVARKGEETPQHIIDKMKKKHRSEDNDKE